ncbi:prepilin peptidase [Nocardia crassostreae]|uniref:prepilin peptidase n=1 Tax=Nocardia crassostreae TaxID=53428 RepID=UPI000831965B|nr:A24 family peptidase [Nocardia crassostreae]
MEPLPLLIFTAWCAALSWFDLRSRRLPNALTLPGAALVLVYGTVTDRPLVPVLGAALLAIPYLLVHLWNPAALGAGDVKLALRLGGATALGGAESWVWAAVGAPVLTAATGLGLLLAASATPHPWLPRNNRRGGAEHDTHRDRSGSAVVPRTLPHGPAMCVASVLALGLGEGTAPGEATPALTAAAGLGLLRAATRPTTPRCATTDHRLRIATPLATRREPTAGWRGVRRAPRPVRSTAASVLALFTGE